MKKTDSVGPSTVLAAGGIVTGDGSNAEKILLVRRRRYGGDVGLPKGKVKDKETLLTTALREVKEETGYDVEIVNYAGTTHYRAGGQQKAVVYFVMKVSAAGKPGALDNGEVEAVEWATPAEARTRLTYSEDRDLIAALFSLSRA